MRRTKHHIITYIPARVHTDYLYRLCEMAQHWSDEINVVISEMRPLGVAPLPGGVEVSVLPEHMWSRAIAYELGTQKGLTPRRPCTVVALEPTWFPSNPHIIREAIEYNSGKALYAKRYFMVDARGYRADGIYAPISVIPIFPYKASAWFNSEVDTAPNHAWTTALRGEAPFDILDMAMYGDEDFAAAGTIRMFEGTIAV